MNPIDPKDCSQNDCHLKCSLAKTCQKCGDKRFQASDWRNFLPFVPVPLGFSLILISFSAFFSRSHETEEKLTPVNFLTGTSMFDLPGLALSLILVVIAWKKGSKFGIRRKCCLESCEADLFKGKCQKCGHPPAVLPWIFNYLAALLGLPAAAYGACMYLSPPVTPVTSAVGNLGLIIAATTVLLGLIFWTTKKK